jgi:nucleotide-binding universal stress UspA family protein
MHSTDTPLKEPRMNASPSVERPFVLVVGVNRDDIDSSGYALDHGARIAMRIDRSEMHVVHVLAPKATDELAKDTKRWLERYITAKATALAGLARQSVGVHVRSGDAAHEIARLASDVAADMILVGTHKAPHLKTLFVGSTAERLLANTSCPVFVAGPRPKPEPSHVIVIEAACDDCLRTRRATQGRSWWCPRHSENHHLHGHHHYSYTTELPFDAHDSTVTSTGV